MFGRGRSGRRHASDDPRRGAGEAAPAPAEANASGPADGDAASGAAEPEQPQGSGSRQRRVTVIEVAGGLAAVAVAAVAAMAYVLTHSGAGQSARQVADGGASAQPLAVRSVTPAGGTEHANGGEPIEIRFSVPLAAGSPTPVLSPGLAGRWTVRGRSMTFTPAEPLAPRTRVRMTIPGGRHGIRSAAGRLLAAPQTVSFRTGRYSQLRLDQLLAQLGYLPLRWASAAGTPAAGQSASGRPGSGQSASGRSAARRSAPGQPASGQPAAAAETGTAPGLAAAAVPGAAAAATGSSGSAGPAGPASASGQAALAYQPPAGQFRWEPGYPSRLHALWRAGHSGVVTTGAVMAFQSQHHMALTGKAGKRLWQALFTAAAAGQRDQHGYTYALARQASPESLTIWHDGRVVLRSPANTGIPVSPTAVGTFPVYLRYPFQIMRGTNPDGSSYADPVNFVSYFHGGDAVHYFPRGSYGFQQSLGCVELPWAAAKRSYPFLTYGSLVTVTP